MGVGGHGGDVIQPLGDLGQGQPVLGVHLQAALQQAPPLRLAAAGDVGPQPAKLQQRCFIKSCDTGLDPAGDMALTRPVLLLICPGCASLDISHTMWLKYAVPRCYLSKLLFVGR